MKNKNALLLIVIGFVVLLVGASVLYNVLKDQTSHDALVTQAPKTAASNETATNAAGNSNGTGTSDDGAEDNPAPDFTVLDKDEREVKLSDFKGTPVVLNFWASWCGPCKSEMPDFNETCKTYENKIQFMMVNLTDGARETMATARAYVDGQGFTFPVFYDTKSEAAMAYGVYSVPTTFFIDAEGNVVAYASGAIDSNTLQKGIDMISE